MPKRLATYDKIIIESKTLKERTDGRVEALSVIRININPKSRGRRADHASPVPALSDSKP